MSIPRESSPAEAVSTNQPDFVLVVAAPEAEMPAEEAAEADENTIAAAEPEAADAASEAPVTALVIVKEATDLDDALVAQEAAASEEADAEEAPAEASAEEAPTEAASEESDADETAVAEAAAPSEEDLLARRDALIFAYLNQPAVFHNVADSDRGRVYELTDAAMEFAGLEVTGNPAADPTFSQIEAALQTYKRRLEKRVRALRFLGATVLN